MALIYYCNNESCEKHGETVLPHKISYVFKEGKLFPGNIPKCPACGKQYSFSETLSKKVPEIAIGEFAGMSLQQKTTTLKKRADIYNKKDGAIEKKEFYRKKAIDKFFGR